MTLWAVVLWLLLTAVIPDAHAAVYRHTDAQGNTVWSDRPSGTRAQVRAPRVLSPAKAASEPAATPSVPAVFIPYQRVSLKPRAAAVTFEQARLGIALRVETVPPLRASDRVQLMINGRRHQSPLASRVLVAMGLAAGRHDLMAEVLDSAGKVRQRSPIMTLEVLAATESQVISP
ncbi:hypothetical protein GCM10010082_11710 [Kushneria pakistanensis]|uniref:DUF4124 domain-containing protein n=2 Tax=Kushneria pakistanensis TaxID=1508770 RepID=A0ABQ3FEX6_9GAMM|nr:hypothetical protein GCM10010082_11710 [Kushneria pakistanensis]